MTMQELDDLKKCKEYQHFLKVEDMLNNMSFDPKKFAKCVRFMHPTIQQNLFRLIREIINEQSNETDRYYDDRNIASHNMAKKLKEVIDNCTLPYI